MKKIVDCAQMKELDVAAIHIKGMPSCVLMERAALKTVEELQQVLMENAKVLVVCGSGNNGGDGIAIGRLLHLQGVYVQVFLAGSMEKMTEETSLQYQIAKNYGVPFVNNIQWDEYTVIVDAIFGVGLTREISGTYRNLIEKMNQARCFKVAVDIPSGIHGDNGSVLGIAFRADKTVTFAYKKRGLCLYPGRMYAGEIVTADIGIYAEDPDSKKLACSLETEDLRKLPKRVPYGNKGTFGKVLVIAGSRGMSGAAFFAAAAALAGGCGMVKIATTEENRIPLQTLLPEAMISCEFSEEEKQKNLCWCDVLVIGPGVGTSKEAADRVHWFLKAAKESNKAVILDADGLNLLAKNPSWREILPERVVLTPHLGEMSRLNGKTIAEIQKDLITTAQACAKDYHAICVLKDACTVIADAEGYVYLNLSGNAGMATAGSGDVLAGLLGAIFCLDTEETDGWQAAAGVFIHGRSGDHAAVKKGMHSMTARDMIEHIDCSAFGENFSSFR